MCRLLRSIRTYFIGRNPYSDPPSKGNLLPKISDIVTFGPILYGETNIFLTAGVFISKVNGNESTPALTLRSITVGPGTYAFMTNITLKGSSRGIINELISYTSLNVTKKTSILIPIKTFVNKTGQIYVTATFNNFSDSVSLEYEFLNYNGTIKISSISLTQFNPPL